MRAVSLPRFLQSLIVVRGARIVLLLLIVAFALLAFGATGVAATSGPNFDIDKPFRW